MAAFAKASPSSPVYKLVPLADISQCQAHLWCPEGSSLAQHGFQAPSSHCTYADCASCWHQWLYSRTAQAAPPAWMLDQSPECMDKDGDGQETWTKLLEFSICELPWRKFCTRTQLLQRKQKYYNVSSRISNYLCWYLKLWVKPGSRNTGFEIKLDKAAWKLHLPLEYASLRTAMLTAFSHLLK